MNKTFTKLKGSLLTAVAFSALAASPAFAQLNYRPNASVNVAGTYTDIGTTGTTLIATANNDDANSTVQPIGFTFNYNGQAFTDFTLNTNGFIKLGNTPMATANVFNWIAAAGNDIIAPGGGVDLQGAANQTTNPTSFRFITTGVAPNRITTIQFKNLSDKATGTTANAQFTTIQFQIKLYETTNVIEFKYGTWVSNGATPTSGQPFMIGLKGSSSAPADRLLAYKPSSATPWTATTFSQIEGGFIPSHFIRNTFLPDPGRTYRFTPVVIAANDLAVTALFVQGKMATTYGTADTIMAIVKNSGSALIIGRIVTLSISGANTFTSSVAVTLPAGDDTLIAFAPFAPTAVGGNFVEVVTPADGDNSNNSKEAEILTTTNTIGYAQYPTTGLKPDIITALSGPYPVTAPTPATRNGKFLTRFFTQNSINVTKVRAYVPGNAFNPVVNTTGITVYGIVLNSAGVEIARSPNKVITAAMTDDLVEFILTAPASIASGTYYVGMVLPAQSMPATGTPATIFGMGVQREDGVRLGTYYTSPAVGNVQPEDFEDTYRFVIEADVTNVTGIKTELNAKLVSVYPNPSNGIFNVSATAMKGNNATLEVRNIQGKVVYSAVAAKNMATLNLSKLSSGIYMLKVSTDQEVAFKRLVIE